MRLNILITATLSMCLIASCKKDKVEPEPIKEYKIDAETLAYIQLPLNSYYIYKDSARGTLDSVVVTESRIEKTYVPPVASTGLFYPAKEAFYYDKFYLKISRFIPTQSNWFYGKTSAQSIGLEETVDNLYGNGPAFAYNITSPAPVSVSVEGKTYSNVVIYSEANGFEPTNANFYHRTYYWSKGVGIIKRSIKTYNSIKTELLVRNG